MSELEALKQENNELKGLLKKAKALMLNSLNNSTTETKECFIASRVGNEAGLDMAKESPAEPKNKEGWT